MVVNIFMSCTYVNNFEFDCKYVCELLGINR